MEAEICIPCREQVARYPGKESCPLCGGLVTPFGEYIDIIKDLHGDL
ncbi:hypothetical protein LCGC14_1887360 [marine sediment metagenome]|uniref:Uncharacterized protein n=1 Tax=marine sediment metagenome TaxID=412755 RepID=A0A0F9IEC4_9ZZZZ